MPLQAVLFDKAKLKEHDNWSEALQALLLSLYQFDVAVVDIGILKQEELGFRVCQDNEEAYTGIQLPVLNCEILFADCLVIADCEDTVQTARAWKTAILGYASPTSGRNQILSTDCGACPVNTPSQEKTKEPLIQSHLDYLAEGFEEVDFDFLTRIYQRHHNLPWTVIETGRCYLREITLNDIDALYELYRPPEITRYMDNLHEEREKEEAYTKDYIRYMYRYYGYGLWVVIEKSTGLVMGRAGIECLDVEGENHLQLGYCIALQKQRQGYAAEVCQGILDYAREALEAEKIYCLIEKENLPSIRLAHKLGFQWDASMDCKGKEMQRYVKFLQFP